MFESLFGAETPLAVRFFVAFIVVFGLIGLIAWLVRRFGTGRIGDSARGRQPRLAVIEAGAVDGRRRLVLIRRDNVEHLLMIGGPSDIVVEQNIVRGQAPGREAPAPRAAPSIDTLPRANPLPEPTQWPLQPEVALRPARPAPVAIDEPQWSPPPEAMPAPRRAARAEARADTLAGLAAELARPEAPAEPSLGNGRMMPQAEPARPAPAPIPASADQNLADMAQRLEAALRRPAAPPGGDSRNGARPAPAPKVPEVPQNALGDVRPGAAETDASKKAFTSLEQEMASLLGRQPGKT